MSEAQGMAENLHSRASNSRQRSSYPPPVAAGALLCLIATSACSALNAWRSSPARPAPQPAAAAEDVLTPDRTPEMSLTSEDDFVVRIVAGPVTCTGSLIAEDRVLTAHHCVAVRGPGGENEAKTLPPRAVSVELGGDHLPWAEVGVRWILAPDCGYNGGAGDIAILVLERRLQGVATRHAELDTPPKKGGRLIPIGFGRCAEESNGISRKRRAGSPVARVLDRRFQLQAAICPGDSGGPGIDPETGRIVGVVSASVMDSSAATFGLSEFTRLDHHRAVFAAAAQVSEGVSPAELPPLDCRRPSTD